MAPNVLCLEKMVPNMICFENIAPNVYFEKMSCNTLLFEKNGAQNQMKTFFFINSLREKIFYKM